MNKDSFLSPINPMQKRYEALRLYFVEKLTAEKVASKFGYSIHTIYSLLKKYKKENMGSEFFLPLKQGPKCPHQKTLDLKEQIIALRKKNYSIYEIQDRLMRQGHQISPKTIHQILNKEGFVRLFRRTNAERLEALQGKKEYPQESDISQFAKTSKMNTFYGGIFLFIPIIIELGLDKIFQKPILYGSKQIPILNYMLSYLVLKLLGRERISHIGDLSFDYGVGGFAGLNVLPKCTAITQYSYRNSGKSVRELLEDFGGILKAKNLIQGKYINLDFHSIPHYGDESQLENNWVPTRGKSMKSILSFFAQDLETTYLCYSHGDIIREEAGDEILEFVKFYRKAIGMEPKYLVFDSKLTTYKRLNELNKKGIKFITLRMRGKYVESRISNVKDWEPVILDNTKRKYRNLKVYSEDIKVKDYDGNLRQMIILGTGRELPTVIITNDLESPAKEIITIYTYRWRIENNIQENVDFFNLNALSSKVVVKVDFDIAITLIANTLYKLLAKEIRRFEKAKPKRIFRNFIECPANIEIDDHLVQIKFAKKSYNPVLMDWVESKQDLVVPWMGNRKLQFKF